ncbi:hypothetical protein DNL40_07050 [Xylanimonas oleitrophica]|uniref:Uncharacterized protein n=1 Tax=Xylanimonas oleitrophica TaxID=2607479 RepID=A0A2W5WZM2_9MICO|nr:hypothetical protein [Xylanimonas oleitrophica]PZR53856.1 hypothetical protein DNL40_07050 [Xylanimonas oleitrophica]
MSSDLAWRSALPHREGAELAAAQDRLEAAGLAPEDVTHVLADLGDELHGQGESGDPLRAALLWGELGAYLAYAQERAASGRRSSYARLAQTASLARVAAQLGVSRQAVHKTMGARDSQDSYVATLSMRGRRPHGG